jgi:ABC-2 type transport system permease protein
VALVARRELVQRSRTRIFRLSVIGLALLAAASVVVGTELGGRKRTFDVGLVGTSSQAAGPLLRQAVQGTHDRVRVRRVASRARAAAAVRDGELDGALVGGRTVLVHDDTRSDTARLVVGVARALETRSALLRAGLAPGQVDAALAPSPPAVVAVEPQSRHRTADLAIVSAGIVLLYLLLMAYGTGVLTSVVEEKASRIVEVLLLTVRPRRLLAGKLLGIGVLGLGQLVVVGAAALLARLATGGGGIPGAGPKTFALTVLWFVLGYALYSAGYAALGSLVSRQEDTSAVQTPVTLVLVVGYLAAFAAVGSPDGGLTRVLTFIPFTAPMVVPARAVLGHLSAGAFAASLVLTLLCVAGLVALAGSLYSRTILHTGGRLRFRQALGRE